jgi:hypothetical protein
LQGIVAALPEHVLYEPGLIIAGDDLVVIHDRIRGWTDEPQIVVDVFRIEDGRLAKHWDVLQNEVPATVPGGVSMFEPDEGGRHDGPEAA